MLTNILLSVIRFINGYNKSSLETRGSLYRWSKCDIIAADIVCCSEMLSGCAHDGPAECLIFMTNVNVDLKRHYILSTDIKSFMVQYLVMHHFLKIKKN